MAEKKLNPGQRYQRRFLLAMLSYGALLAIAIPLALAAGDSPWRFGAMALPVPAMVAVVWAVVRFLREADEFVSRTTVEALAIGFGGGSLVTFTYGLMQTVGAPPLNWMFVWAVYASCWILGALIVRRRYL